jgi:NitT/TauT family transport system substrate-binding protein
MTNVGKVIFGLLVLALIGSGVLLFVHKPKNTGSPGTDATPVAEAPNVSELQKELADALPFPKRIPPAQPYNPKDGVLEIELSEWVGYAGLIAHNGGLDPNPEAGFTKKTGLKLKLTVSESESWDNLVTGKLGGSATTVDVLAVYGKQLAATVPVQFDFSRGADAIVVRNEVAKINDLQGKIVACAQFTESDFLLRALAREAGLQVNLLPDLNSPPAPDKINVVVTDEGAKAGDVFIHDLKGGFNKLAGCVTWSPKTEEVVAGSDGKARILTTNRNLLIVADVLLLNKQFADQRPDVVQALAEAVIDGNSQVTKNPAGWAAIVEKAFKWDKGKFNEEVKKVHFSNLPENNAFFGGSIDSAGSFDGIYQMAVLSYGPSIIKDDTDSKFFVNMQGLDALAKSGRFNDQKVAIAPIKINASGQSLEANPLLSKNIKFFFEPNSTKLDSSNPQNQKNFEDIKKLLQVSPGSTIVLRGHVDDAQVESFRKSGGETFVQQMALKAVKLSKDRAESVREALVAQNVDPVRLSTVGRGWEEPVEKAIGSDPEDVRRQKSEKNRRVEAVWVTIE